MKYSIVFFLFVLCCVAEETQKPNIILIIADDMGWSDIGVHTDNLIHTPTLDSFMKDGIALQRIYAQDVCSPTRASILTGRYPSHYGLQHYVICPQEREGLPLNETTLPSLLKQVGYSTHAIGKWHQGFWKWAYTPTFRGFDTFYGFYNGGQDYYTHSVNGGYDFRRDNGPNCGEDCSVVDYNANGKYSTTLFSEEAVNVIKNHTVTQPFYLYLAYQALHDPTEVPEEYVKQYEETIPNQKRRKFAGMVSCMDEGIANITKALKEKGMYENTLFIFTSDNGGPINNPSCSMCGDYAGALNYPLRGGKHTLYEGGVRVNGALAGDYIKNNKGHPYSGYMHTSDFLPTIMQAIGLDVYKNGTDQMTYIKLDSETTITLSLDGFALWDDIINEQKGVRDEIILNFDHTGMEGPYAGIVYKEWKLLLGHVGCPYGWYLNNLTYVEATDLNSKATTDKQIELIKDIGYPEDSILQLFNIVEDPNEHNECMKDHADIVEDLLVRLVKYKKTYVNPYIPKNDPNSAPSKHNNTWVPWGDL